MKLKAGLISDMIWSMLFEMIWGTVFEKTWEPVMENDLRHCPGSGVGKCLGNEFEQQGGAGAHGATTLLQTDRALPFDHPMLKHRN